MVMLKVQVEATGKTFPIPCFALEPCQPLWQGELKDCEIQFQMNALLEHGFHVTYSDGTAIEPTSRNGPSSNVVRVLHAMLGETMHPVRAKQ